MAKELWDLQFGKVDLSLPITQRDLGDMADVRVCLFYWTHLPWVISIFLATATFLIDACKPFFSKLPWSQPNPSNGGYACFPRLNSSFSH